MLIDHSLRPGDPAADHQPAKIALLGSGTVGMAVLDRLAGWNGTELGNRLKLVYAANTRLALADPGGLEPSTSGIALNGAKGAPTRSCSLEALNALGTDGVRILIDATANAAVASQHPALLGAGVHVATACKIACGTSLELWREIKASSLGRGTGFGDRATVGAGLPLLRSLRELRHGGDTIHAIAGVMSGSLAWLFDRYDGTRPFSDLVLEAHRLGLTEPDPRDDLSGEDVRRKILIMARAAGFELEAGEVAVQSLVPDCLAQLPREEALTNLQELDAVLAEQFGHACASGGTLRFVARLSDGRARVGLENLRPGDPLANGRGTENRVAIFSDRYRDQPLIIQGPGAGAEVTAAALLDDALQLDSWARGNPFR